MTGSYLPILYCTVFMKIKWIVCSGQKAPEMYMYWLQHFKGLPIKHFLSHRLLLEYCLAVQCIHLVLQNLVHNCCTLLVC